MNALALVLTMAPDTRLLGPWLDHYGSSLFDKILVGVHVAPWDDRSVLEGIRKLLSARGIALSDVHTSAYVQEDVRRQRMIKAHCSPRDWVFVADIEDFHEYPMPPRALVERCVRTGRDRVAGEVVDRVAPEGKLLPLDGTPLWDRYPVGVRLAGCFDDHAPVTMIVGGTAAVMAGDLAGVGDRQDPAAERVTVHRFAWDAAAPERCRSLAWQYALAGDPRVEAPRNVLARLGGTGRIDLSDRRLRPYWPGYRRSETVTDGAARTNVDGDPVFVRPRRCGGAILERGIVSDLLVDRHGNRTLAIGPTGARAWELCDGARTIGEIANALVKEFPRSAVESESGLQTFVKELHERGLLELV